MPATSANTTTIWLQIRVAIRVGFWLAGS
nr:hypothetical protein [Tanacetum cinerariifolium]